ncbi:MAG: GNAT family N-acetyltransferase [Patescibacteria group bacterium]
MNIIQESSKCSGIKLKIQNKQGKEIGRAFLYVMYNDLHLQPFGLIEDVFIVKKMRGHGHGKALVKQVIELAKEKGCYKLIATSRHSRSKVHKLYIKLGFHDQGTEFRFDF